MAHEDWSMLVGVALWDEALDLVGKEEVRRQSNNATKLVLASGSSKERHGASLGETTENNALRWDTGVYFLLNEAMEVFPGGHDTSLVLLCLKIAEASLLNYQLMLEDALHYKTWDGLLCDLQYRTSLACAFHRSAKLVSIICIEDRDVYLPR